MPLRHAPTAIAVLALLALTGCEYERLSDAEAVRLAHPAKRYPFVVEPQRASIELPSDGYGLKPGAYVDAKRFVTQYKRDGRGPLTVAVSHRGGPGAASIRQIVAAAGIAPERVRYVERRGGGGVTLTFDKVVAVSSSCGDWSESISRNPETGPHANFGCASRRNLANMVADPTDLLYSAPEDDQPSDRRGTLYRDYSKTAPGAAKDAGQATSTGTKQ